MSEDPFEPPTVDGEFVDPSSPLRHSLLQTLQSFRDRSMTPWRLLTLSRARRWQMFRAVGSTVLIVVVMVLYSQTASGTARSLCIFFIGFLAGKWLQIWAYLRASSNMWPFQRELFDWQKIDRELETLERETGEATS